MKTKTSYGAAEWLILVALAVIWGSSFILMKRGLEGFSAPQVAAVRMFVACLCLLPFVVFHLRNIEPSKWKYLAASALLGNGVPALLFTVAQTKISSSVAGILNSLTPLFTMIVAVLVFKNKISRIHVFGVIIGFAGAATILLFRANGNFEGNYYFGLLIVLATIFYAISINIIKNYLREMSPLIISGVAVSIAGIPYGIYLFTTDFTERISSGNNSMNLIYILLLGIFGTAISLVLFNKLIKTASVLFASSVTYLIPVVALMWGFLDGETFGTIQIFGMGAILAGVYIVNRH